MKIRHQSALSLLLLTLIACTTPPPSIQQGRVDLTKWKFTLQGEARLDGEWDFWWGQKILNPSLAQPADHTWAQVPGFWNSDAVTSHPAAGSATYHLQVQLGPQAQDLALILPDICTAYQFWVNGQLLAQQGVPADQEAGYQARIRPHLVRLTAVSGSLDLTLYVANYLDRIGGIRDSIRLGDGPSLANQWAVFQWESAFIAGGLLVMGLFNVIVYFLQRQKKANLWLALFSFFIALRTLFTGPRIIQDLVPNLSLTLSSQIEFFTILAAVSVFAVYLKYLFMRWWPTKLMVSFLFYTLFFFVLLFALPLKAYAEVFLKFYDIPLATIILTFLAISFWAAVQRHEEGLLVFSGMIFLVTGTLNDILYQFMSLPQGYVMGKFLFIFLIFNSFLLSRQMAKSYRLTEKQSEDLQKLDQMKDDFLARVTHELRTPLHGIVGILDAFRMGDFGPLAERQIYHLNLLDSSSKRLLTMVNSILDFSHLKQHQLMAEARPIRLKETIDFLIPSLSKQAKPGVAILNHLSPQLPPVLGDEIKVEQILHHLLQNALQHTVSGTVTMEAEVKNQEVHLSIRDTGEGIPAQLQDNLFSPFHQTTDANTRSTNGLGLGLAISKQLLLQMNGELEIQSEENKGTTAIITLPLCPPAKISYYTAQRRDREIHFEQGQLEASSQPAEPEPRQPALDPAPAMGSPSVLIVDDEPVNLMILRSFLNRLGYRLSEASSGPQALQILTETVIDLVILDIMMPQMSGYEVCTKIRERFTPARLPVILLTAKNQMEDLIQGFSCGASDFMTKPFDRNELKARMEFHLQLSTTARSGQVIADQSAAKKASEGSAF